MLTFPRKPVVEFYLDGWRDVSTDVRQKPAISITHGRKDWAAKVSPSTCKFTVDDGPEHGDGDYDPNNPLGQWYGQLGRNTPVRVSLLLGRDDYARTVLSGWGTSPDMGDWSLFFVGDPASDVTAGTGRHLVAVNGNFIASYLSDVSYRDVDVSVEATYGAITVTGGALELANLMARGQAGGDCYLLRVEVTTTQQVRVSLMVAGGAVLAGPVTVFAYPGAASTLGVRFQAEGTTLRGTVWRTDQGEPLGWSLEYSLNPDSDVMLGAGWVGVRSGVAAGNTNIKPIIARYDQFTVRLPRFSGETSKMVPLTTVDHKDQRTTVECASVRRRLSKGEKVLQTALYRYLTGGGLPFTVTDFWPLDYPPQASQPGTNVLGAGQMRFVRTTGGALKWGTDTGILPVQRAVTIVPPDTGSSGQMFAPLDASKFNAANGFAAVWLQRLGSDREAAAILDLTNGEIILLFAPGTVTVQWSPDVGALVPVMTVGIPQLGDDTVWHMIGLSAQQSGGSAKFGLAVDGDNYEVTLAATTIGVPDVGIQWAAFPETVDGYQVTQALMIDRYQFTGSPWYVTRIRDAMLGHPGESAGKRFARLCAEEGVPTSLTGAQAGTPPMGPQRPLTLPQLVQECVDVDQGAAFDPKGAPGLGMRTLGATVAQDPVMTLAYMGQVSPEFGPTVDDQGTLNDVTAKRPNGGEYRVEQATGPNNTADPGTDPGAAGRYDTTVTTNVAGDWGLPDQAGWRVHMGTVDEPRYPTVTVDLAADDVAEDPDLVAAVLDVAVDDAITITGAQARRIYDDVRLVVRGYAESIDTAFQHRIVFNTTPASPYDGARLDQAGVHLDAEPTASTTTATFVAGTNTSMSVASTGGTLWSSANAPFDIVVAGARLTVTAVTGTSSPQTFTVTQAPVNGVAKTIPAGVPVRLFRPRYLVP